MEASFARSPAGASVLLVLATALAAALIYIVQLGFARMLGQPWMAAWTPAAQEGLFGLLLFGLLGAAAAAGMRLCHVRASAGAPAAGLALIGIAGGCVGVGLALLLSALAGAARSGSAAGWTLLPFVAGTLVTLVQTAAEELYFRGWLQPSLQAGWGRWKGIVASAAAFAALHFVTGVFDAISLFNLFLAGLFFGLLADRSGGLLLPIGAHFGWNWGEEMLLGLTPNPGVSNYGTLLDWDMAGARLWGGSAEGLNASLSVSFVLAALVVAAWSWGGSVSSPGQRG